ncbi:MAG: ElyC/SanA/YdcF family protein [Patescibacteria group bacterium]|nr:ElyC/SanA/YdcF family protein [Patescibacteria group bacterium]
MKLTIDKKAARYAVSTLIAGTLFIAVIIVNVRYSYRNLIYSQSAVPQKPTIIVLGAALKPNGQPSDALLDRLQVGLDLYLEQKGDRILVTGDNGAFHTNEVAAMKDFLIDNGVRDIDVLTDGRGYRTHESCKRAKEEFNITQAIIVTQNFHLPRALYLCNKMGVNSVGVSADLHTYRDIIRNVARDWLASFKAWIDIDIWTPRPPV